MTAMAMPGPIPQGKYVPAQRFGSFVFTAGMTPRREGRLVATGIVSVTQPLESYRGLVELACANALTATRKLLGDDDRIVKVMTMNVFIAAEPGFEAHSQLADFASDYLHRELGEAGICARAALGVATLPGGAPVEIQLVSAIATNPRA